MIDFGMRYCTDIHSVNIIGLSNIVIETFFFNKNTNQLPMHNIAKTHRIYQY